MEVLGQVETAVKTMGSMERRASTITHQMNRLDTFKRTAAQPLHETTASLAEARQQVRSPPLQGADGKQVCCTKPPRRWQRRASRCDRLHCRGLMGSRCAAGLRRQ
jgi:hypothetical protein